MLNAFALSLTLFSIIADSSVAASGAVYVMTNRVGAVGNSILIFDRDTTDGTLRRVGLVDTGGNGGIVGLAGIASGLSPATFAGQTPDSISGSPNDALASQDSLLISDSSRCLFAVNAGSNTITSFVIQNEGNFLNMAGIYPSGGDFPISISQRGNLVYVLNGGGTGNINGFRYSDRLCTLDPLEGSTRTLHNIDFNPPSLLFAPAQVAITPDAKGIVATVKGTHEIHYWGLSALGYPDDRQVVTPSNGFVPFSFDFDGNGNLVVGEAFGAGTSFPSPFTGAVSTYAVNSDDGTLNLISASIPNQQTATCWLRYDFHLQQRWSDSINQYLFSGCQRPPRFARTSCRRWSIWSN